MILRLRYLSFEALKPQNTQKHFICQQYQVIGSQITTAASNKARALPKQKLEATGALAWLYIFIIVNFAIALFWPKVIIDNEMMINNYNIKYLALPNIVMKQMWASSRHKRKHNTFISAL